MSGSWRTDLASATTNHQRIEAMKIAVLEEVARTGKCMAFSNAVHAVQKGMPNPINIALLELSHDLRLINQTAQLAI